MMDRPTFSQSWSRVAKLTPTLRPQVEVTRHLFRGEPWHVVHDPVSNSFFRLNPVAHHFVGLMDGRRSVDEAWRLTLDRFGDLAPTQNEVIGLLGQLNQSNLLRVDDLPADAEQLITRNRRRRLQWWAGQATSLLFIRIPVFNPEPVLRWLYPIMRPVLSKWGMMAWFAWICFCLYVFVPHMGEFFSVSQQVVLDPNNWGWMAVVFILTKAWHEIGHGLVCKRFGGVVPEFGFMMLVLFPAPYMDATASWGFASKWKRLLVGAAGMVFELAVAGGAAIIWVWVAVDSDGAESMTAQICYNLVFVAAISTVLFNANPLLRFDGYYMLSDLLEVPNLYSRAQNQLKYIFKRIAFGMDKVPPVSVSLREQFWLTFYGIAALIYRVLILTGIVIFIAGKLFELGLLLAAWSILSWLIFPTVKFIKWLFTHPALQEHRVRAVVATAAMTALVVGLFGVLPVEDHGRAPGVIESTARSNLTMGTTGFIQEVRVKEGQKVKERDVILRADNPELRAKKKDLEAELARLEVGRIRAIASDPNNQRVNQAQIEAKESELKEVNERLENLVLRSPQDGVITVTGGRRLDQLQGQFLGRGSVIARVEDMDHLRVTAVITQTASATGFLDQIEKVEMRFAGRLDEVFVARSQQVLPGGRMTLPHPALGYRVGGSIPVDPTDSSGLKTLRPIFEMHLTLPPDLALSAGTGPIALPGQRVYTRFTMHLRRPLFIQGLRSLRQLFRERLQL